VAVVKVLKKPPRQGLVARATGELHIDDVLTFVRTVRASPKNRQLPLLFDARGCTTSMTAADVETAINLVQTVVQQGPRAPVALIADDPILHAWCIAYGTRCAALGLVAIRTFESLESGHQWLAKCAESRRKRLSVTKR
jgi:hypothetical protein